MCCAEAPAGHPAAAPASTGPDRPHVTLVDGRSGSGKTTWATARAAAEGATLLSLDDVYPGWDGLEAAEAHVLEHVLRPLAAGRPARYRRWDWTVGQPADWVEVDARRPLIIEGCGALSAAARALAHRGVWVELDDVRRRERALARDGEAFRPHWERWAAQEEQHAALHAPRAWADEVVDGAVLGEEAV